MVTGQPNPIDFYSRLVWLDGRPLLDTIEPYRQKILMDVLATAGADGWPQYNFALCGRGKKNWKTSDLILAALYRFLAWSSPQGNDAYILANDEGQANDDLSLAKKLVAVNPPLAQEIGVYAKELVRIDGCGSLKILPARDAIGAHGKTYVFLGFDEIHGFRNHDLFEALAPDPTRHDALVWVTSYAALRHAPGIPIFDYMEAGKRGDDERMYFSWYAGDFTTDAGVPEDATPEVRANPSMASWGNTGYLAQQKCRLPTHKYRRLHLNLPGAPDGAFLDQGAVLAAIVAGRHNLPPQPGIRYHAFVDMSGRSSDDATLAIAHKDGRRIIVDLVVNQAGKPPFNPRQAVAKFAAIVKNEYRIASVTGDLYAGQTFPADFAADGITYKSSTLSRSELYEHFEPRLNAGEIELLDVPKLQEQLLTLVMRGTKIDHQPGDHDDWANAVAGAVWLASSHVDFRIPDAALARFAVPYRREMPDPYRRDDYASSYYPPVSFR